MCPSKSLPAMDGHRALQPPPTVAGGRYEVCQPLNHGAFAEVWLGRDARTKELVAIKFEDYEDQAMQLEDEVIILQTLATPTQPQGFARVYYSGDEGHFHCMVTDLLGQSLADLLPSCGGRYPVGAVLLIAEQMISRIAYLHSKGILHRDLKPENFMFGRGQRVHHLYLIDFGLSRSYLEGGRHIPMRTGLHAHGTLRYVSMNTLRGSEPSRRDDLEALGYVLVYLLRGSLPWSGVIAPSAEELPQLLLSRRTAMPLARLCAGLPDQFQQYLRDTQALAFEEVPDYDALWHLFHDLREEEGPASDSEFPWLTGRPLGVLEPLTPWEAPCQPDGPPGSGTSLVKRPLAALAAGLSRILGPVHLGGDDSPLESTGSPSASERSRDSRGTAASEEPGVCMVSPVHADRAARRRRSKKVCC